MRRRTISWQERQTYALEHMAERICRLAFYAERNEQRQEVFANVIKGSQPMLTASIERIIGPQHPPRIPGRGGPIAVWRPRPPRQAHHSKPKAAKID